MSYTYTLNVTRREALTLEQKEQWSRGYIRTDLEQHANSTSLTVELTEEQWQAVQKAVLETFK